MSINIVVVDYTNAEQGKDLVELLNSYALDPMGGGEALESQVKNNLVAELAKCSHAFSVMAYVNDKPAGLINCFFGFSTFICKPLVNIHDVVVSSEFRGLGLSQKMLEKVEQYAKSKGSCKLTLEVLQGNEIAKASYRKFGFAGYELDPEMGNAMFWQKKI